MKFKIDENLPAEAAEILRGSGFVADTVGDGDLSGARRCHSRKDEPSGRSNPGYIDLDFANIRAYPPGEHAGIVVLRVKDQDKFTVLSFIRRLAVALTNRNPSHELWIVDGNRIRFRQST